MSKIIKSIKIAVGIPMLFLSSFGVVFGIVAMIDPVGIPPTFVESLSLTLFYAGVFFLGIWLILGSRKLKKILRTNLQ